MLNHIQKTPPGSNRYHGTHGTYLDKADNYDNVSEASVDSVIIMSSCRRLQRTISLPQNNFVFSLSVA